MVTSLRSTRNCLAAWLVVAVLCTGAVTSAWAELINTEHEIAIGEQVAHEVESRYGIIENPIQTRQLEEVGLRIAKVSDRSALPWKFKILNTRQVNAISLPGGIIYLTTGMMSFLRFEDELAFVLGHEVGHVSRRHHVRLLERNFYIALVIQFLFGNQPRVADVAGMANLMLAQGFNRELEFEADHLGVSSAHKAGFDASAALGMMERLRRAEGKDPTQFEVFFRTHPALADRIVRVKTQLRELGYRTSEGWVAA